MRVNLKKKEENEIKLLNNMVGKYNSIGRILDCDSKGCEFESRYLPNIYYFNYIKYIKSPYIVFNYSFIEKFSSISYKIFNEGFLIDFNQKKLASNLLKKSIFTTFYLFNDKFIFEKIVFILIDFLTFSKNFIYLLEIKSPNFYFNLLFIYFLVIFLFLF